MALNHPQLEAFRRKVIARYGDITVAVVVYLHGRLVYYTPVDTGRARSNWNVAVNQADLSVTIKPPPGVTLPAPAAPVIRMQPGDVIWVTNNVPYIRALNNGHSQKAPFKFFELSVLQTEAFFQSLVRRVAHD